MTGTTHPDPHSSERSYLAAAHNASNSEEARKHAAQEYAKLHEARTGEKVDVNEVLAHTGPHTSSHTTHERAEGGAVQHEKKQQGGTEHKEEHVSHEHDTRHRKS